MTLVIFTFANMKFRCKGAFNDSWQETVKPAGGQLSQHFSENIQVDILIYLTQPVYTIYEYLPRANRPQFVFLRVI